MCRPLGNLLRRDCLGSELTTVHPVSTLVSASSFSKLLFRLKTFILALGSRRAECRGSWASVAWPPTWDEQPRLFGSVSLEPCNVGLPLGSGNSREATLDLLPPLLRRLSSRALLGETGIALQAGRSVSAPEVPFLTPRPGFDWICGTNKRQTNVTNAFCSLSAENRLRSSHPLPSCTYCRYSVRQLN